MAATAQGRQTLKKLVALKRQKAEQDFALAKAALQAEEQRLAQLQAELSAIDANAGDYVDFALSMRFGRTAHLMRRIEAARQGVALKRKELDAAREAFKNVLYSEDRVGEV